MKIITARKYASAIFSLAKQENVVGEIISDLESVQEKFDESPSFYKHLGYHKLTLEKKKVNLEEVFSDFISKRTYKILMLLIKNKNLSMLKNIIKDIVIMKKEDEEVFDAKIITSLPLNENQKNKIKSILQDKTGKQIIIHEILDPKIIGGAKIIIGDLVIDGTIKGKIERLRESIKNLD